MKDWMKPCALLDVNVLLALVWRDHPDHARVGRWLRSWAPKSWAVCPLTESGFIRISATPAFTPGAIRVSEAVNVLRHLAASPGYVRFPAMPDPLDARFEPIWRELPGHKLVTDALLLGTAIAEDAYLATLDTGIAKLSDDPARVILIP